MSAATLPTPFARPTRQHPRVFAPFIVELRSGASAVLARAFDLSLDGVGLTDPAGALRNGSETRVAIRIPGEAREVVAPARVARRAGDKVGLTFLGLEWDDLLALARYLSPRL